MDGQYDLSPPELCRDSCLTMHSAWMYVRGDVQWGVRVVLRTTRHYLVVMSVRLQYIRSITILATSEGVRTPLSERIDVMNSGGCVKNVSNRDHSKINSNNS